MRAPRPSRDDASCRARAPRAPRHRVRGHSLSKLRRRSEFTACQRLERVVRSASRNQRPQRKQLPQHHREREHIRATINRLSARLLRSHVHELSNGEPVLCSQEIVRSASHTEVADLHRSLDAHEHVCGRHIAMHDPERLPLVISPSVRVIELRRGLADGVQRGLERKLSRPARRALQQLREGRSIDEFEREKESAYRRNPAPARCSGARVVT